MHDSVILCAICLLELMRLIYDASIHPGPVTALCNLYQKERLGAIIYFYSLIVLDTAECCRFLYPCSGADV